MAYLHNDLRRCEDVCSWLKSLGKEYAVYAGSFKQNNVDGFWLLNHVDETKLVEYGIKNKIHRQLILAGIEKLRKQCS